MTKIYYTIYKIIDNINNKEYIGKHETRDINDSYMGSGVEITAAIKNHGKDNFTKEILFIFETEKEMNSKEKEIVTKEYCSLDYTYNKLPGGKGGWGFVNQIRESLDIPNPMKSKESVNKRNKTLLETNPNHYSDIGKIGQEKLSNLFKIEGEWLSEYKENHKKSLPKDHQKGKINSQYGKKFRFVNDGIRNFKIPEEQFNEYIKKGYISGRIKRFS